MRAVCCRMSHAIMDGQSYCGFSQFHALAIMILYLEICQDMAQMIQIQV